MQKKQNFPAHRNNLVMHAKGLLSFIILSNSFSHFSSSFYVVAYLKVSLLSFPLYRCGIDGKPSNPEKKAKCFTRFAELERKTVIFVLACSAYIIDISVKNSNLC